MYDPISLPPSSRHRPAGLTPAQERVFHWFAAALVTAMLAGWVVAVTEATANRTRGDPPVPVVARRISSSILDSRSTSTAYISDAMLEFADPLRGESGKLHATFRAPGEPLAPDASPAPGATARYSSAHGDIWVSPEFEAPEKPGIYRLAVQVDQAVRAVNDLSIVTLVPFSEKRKGRIGLYYLGSWPFESGGRPRSKAYANPSGFIEVTPENRDLLVSEHFRLGDFLTKGQNDVWPKYLLLDPNLLDKLELLIAELQYEGHEVRHVAVMSGFRTPGYNVGGGNTAGRADLSRHMYGDASDVFVDNDRNGVMDDLNRDGRVDTRDADIVAAAAGRVEAKYPALVGGVGTYAACCGHGPFVHVDVRGYRARWRGTGNG